MPKEVEKKDNVKTISYNLKVTYDADDVSFLEEFGRILDELRGIGTLEVTDVSMSERPRLHWESGSPS